jgi:pimeloyl-ACP methyl ester carboxylesterase
MNITKNITLQGKHHKPILTDVFYIKNNKPKAVIIFAHGYKGYKDWGCWNLVAEAFAKQHFFFVKFNFSHNGGTVEQPIDFPDLEAFGQNNYTKELDDLESVINWVLNEDSFNNEIDTTNIILIGHSRGGGIVTIKAAEDSRITHLITWAAVSNFGNRSSTIGNLEQWKTDGVKYVLNGRTKQQMPHYYQFYEDFKANEIRLTIELSAKKVKIPHLIIHGTGDTSVSIKEAEDLHTWNLQSELYTIKNANHTFEAKHPWKGKNLPNHLKQVLEKSIDFCV